MRLTRGLVGTALFLVALTVLSACTGNGPQPTRAPQQFARFFFAAPGDRGVFEVSTSPPSICYGTQSSPPRPIGLQAHSSQGAAHIVVAYAPDSSSDFCDRSVKPELAADLIAHPSGYTIAWRPQAGAPIAYSTLMPQA